MKARENDIHGTFKMICNLFVQENDYYKASKIFAPYDNYTIDMLLKITTSNSNVYYLEKAKQSLIDYLNKKQLYSDGSLVWIDKEGLDLYIRDIDYKNVAKRDKQTKERLYYLSLVAFVVCVYSPKIVKMEEEKISLDSVKNNFEKPNVYYRGQSNCDWRLSPSILRNLNKNMILNNDSYYKFLVEDEAEQKYNELMRGKDTNTYDKYAFMQHSRSFSPFVDFTTNMDIAVSFALSNVIDANSFRNTDSSVFQLEVISLEKQVITDKDEAEEFLKNKFELIVLNKDYFILGHDYKIEKSDGSTMIYNIVEFNKLVDELTPKFKILKIPTNDRMRYQKGLFLCFYGCLCLNEFIFYELNGSMLLKKHIINTASKRLLLKDIYKKRKYDPEHLMDPYLYFKE